MWLKEVVFQGIFDVDSPARLKVEPDFCALNLPPGATPRAFLAVIVALLYPDQVSEAALRHLADGQGDDLRIGLVADNDGCSVKVFRQAPASSVAAQFLQSGRDNARGAERVADVLAEALHLPAFEDFYVLHALQFGDVWTAPVPQDLHDHYARYVDLVRRDSLALRQMRLSTELSDLQQELQALRSPAQQIGALNSQISELRRRIALSDEDRAVLETSNVDHAEIESQLEVLQLDLGDLKDERDKHGLPPIYKEWLLLGSIALALVIFIVSAATGVRAIALANLVVLGITASTLLRRFGRLEDVSVYDVKAAQIQRRMAALTKARDGDGEERQQVLERIGCDSLAEFHALERELEQLEQKLVESRALASDPSLGDRIKQTERRRAVAKADLDDVDAKLADLDSLGASPEELEEEMVRAGIPRSVLRSASGVELALATPISTAAAVGELSRLAVSRGLGAHGKLVPKVTEPWLKLVGHVLGPQWAQIELDDDRVTGPGASSQDEWGPQRPAEFVHIVRALALAIVVATAADQAGGQFRLLCVADPYAGMDAERQGRWLQVLKSMAGRVNVLLLQ